GINLQQSKETKHLVVTRTIEDGPAETAGIKAGDEIVGIDGLNAIGMTPEQAAEHIRGKQGTAVQVAVSHAGVAKTVNITRQE
ncbi:PDZ domain-containing protein, partial [Klebsiella pneumoniae]|uniref:PDZ domain-containing protein n=1 Tax=Klebsiella pneumoniae TaxID=573 RepID=UPI003CE8E69A